jgi:hypothetical protein
LPGAFVSWPKKPKKEGKMKKLVYAFALIGVLALMAVQALAVSLQSFDSVVEGKNDPSSDVKAVQEAVSKGGTVLLKGTFDFGKKGRVNITKDITILGEADKDGNPLTKIHGGFWTFFSPLPSKGSPPKAPGPKVAIRGIHFDGAIWTPLHFPYISGAEISHNIITNVLPFQVPHKWKGGETLLLHAGAVFGTRFVHQEKILPTATGKLIFANNRVDLKNQNPTMIMGQGAFFIWTWGADILVRENHITNVTRNSIETIDNYVDEKGRGTVNIENNKIVTPTEGIEFPSPVTPNGIVAGCFLDMSAGTNPRRYSKIHILGNYIEVRGKTGVGIGVLSDKVVVGFNEIVVGGGPKASGIGIMGSDGLIAKNTFKGSGAFAMGTRKWGPLTGCRNSFVWNDISKFKGSVAHVAFTSNDNFVLGSSCKIVDQGQNNRKLIGGK